VEIKDTIASNEEKNEERFEKMFEKKIEQKLDKELGGIRSSIKGNAASIKGNTKSFNGLSKSVRDLSASVERNSSSISENSASIERGNKEDLSGLSATVARNSNYIKKFSIEASHAAYRDEWTTADAKITFEKVLVGKGVGQLNPTTGVFTCGQTGTYLVSWSCFNRLASGQMNYIYLYRNGSEIPESIQKSLNGSGGQEIGHQGGRSMLLSLNLGDELWLQADYFFEGTANFVQFNLQLVAVE